MGLCPGHVNVTFLFNPVDQYIGDVREKSAGLCMGSCCSISTLPHLACPVLIQHENF